MTSNNNEQSTLSNNNSQLPDPKSITPTHVSHDPLPQQQQQQPSPQHEDDNNNNNTNNDSVMSHILRRLGTVENLPIAGVHRVANQSPPTNTTNKASPQTTGYPLHLHDQRVALLGNSQSPHLAKQPPKTLWYFSCTTSYVLLVAAAFTFLLTIFLLILVWVNAYMIETLYTNVTENCMKSTATAESDAFDLLVMLVEQTANNVATRGSYVLTSTLLNPMVTKTQTIVNFLDSCGSRNASEVQQFMMNTLWINPTPHVISLSFAFSQNNTYVDATMCNLLQCDGQNVVIANPSDLPDSDVRVLNDDNIPYYPGTLFHLPATVPVDASELPCHQSLWCNYSYGDAPILPSRLGNTLQRCILPVTVFDGIYSLEQQPRNTNCTQYSGFSGIQQVPFQNQINYAATTSATTPSTVIWSLPYIVQANSIFNNQSMVGMSVSFPYIPCPTQHYSCLAGVAWGTVTTATFAKFCLDTLQDYVNTRITFNSHITTNDTLLYVLDRRSGVLLGAANGHNVGFAPTQLALAQESPVTSIRNNANLLLQTITGGNSLLLNWMDPAFDSPIYLRSDSQDLASTHYINTSNPCDGLGLGGPTFILDSDLIAQIIKYENCSLTVTAPVMSFPYGMDDQQQRDIDANLLLVFHISKYAFVSNTVVALKNLTMAFNAQKSSDESYLRQVIVTSAAISAALIVAGCVVAVLVAWRITKPLEKLQLALERLSSLETSSPIVDDDGNAPLSRVSEIAQVQRTFMSLENSIRVFSRFVPETVVKGIVRGNAKASRLHVERRRVTILFSDIRGFTSISEKISQNDLLFLLTRYLTVMTRIVETYQGVVTEILGDGLLVLFNAPDRLDHHESMACACALAMQLAVKQLSTEFAEITQPHGLPALEIRVGINTGDVLAGNLGSATKLKYGCLGDAVNLSSRLEGLCKYYSVGILVSEGCWRGLVPQANFVGRMLDEVQVKGKDVSVKLYEVWAMRGDVTSTSPEVGSMMLAATSSSAQEQVAGEEGTKRSKLATLFGRKMGPGRNSAGQWKTSMGGVGGVSNATFGPISSMQSMSGMMMSDIEYEDLCDAYGQAWSYFVKREWNDAETILSRFPKDGPSQVLLGRIALAKQQQQSLSMGGGDGGSWTHVNRLTEKF